MTDDFFKEWEFLERKDENKTYGSKSFSYKDFSTKEQKNARFVRKTFSTTEFAEYIREKDKVTLYKTPNHKQELVAFIDEDTKEARFTLQRFTSLTGSPHKWQFSFGLAQLKRINEFVESLPYIDYSRKQGFIISDDELRKRIEKLKSLELAFEDLSESDLKLILSSEKLVGRDFVNLAFRNKGLETFENLLKDRKFFDRLKTEKGIKDDETLWQLFFKKHDWIFGHGLDYRFMTIFDREMTVGDGGTQDRGKPKVDFLNEFSDFTVLVEIKTPEAQIFKKQQNNRTGTWSLHADIINAYSQVLEQKAEWSVKGDRGDNLSKDGSKKLEKRTRDPKIILLFGDKNEQIQKIENVEERELKQDTFELFRRDSRNVEILTFDELYERAYYIVHKSKSL